MHLSGKNASTGTLEPIWQMGNSCMRITTVPCFRVTPHSGAIDATEDKAGVSYRLPWEEKQKQRRRVSEPYCFCWCCLCTCHCKQSATKTKHDSKEKCFTSRVVDYSQNGEERFTIEKVSQWKTNFESLLNDEDGKQVFRAFLKKEFSEENLTFWIDVQQMKSLQDSAVQYFTIKKIYKEYIQARANKEVNVEAWVRRSIEERLDQPSADIFDLAQTQVYLLMYRQSWPRFLASKHYQNLIVQTKV